MSLCHDRIFLCRDRVLAKAKRFLVVIVYFLSHDKLWLRQRASCLDKVFCVATGCGQDQGVLCIDKSICVMTELG